MPKVIAVLATLDTKGQEAEYLRQQLKALGSRALVVDMGVMGTPAAKADVTRAEVARAGGTTLSALKKGAMREAAQPVMAAGATKILLARLKAGTVHGVIGLGGTLDAGDGVMASARFEADDPDDEVDTLRATEVTASPVSLISSSASSSVGDVTAGSALVSEARVQPVDRTASLRLRALWKVIGPFERLVGAEAITVAVRGAADG